MKCNLFIKSTKHLFILGAVLFTACGAKPEPEVHQVKRPKIELKNKAYLQYDSDIHKFIKIVEIQPKMRKNLELSEFKEYGFNTLYKKKEAIPFIDLGVKEDFTVLECTDNKWSLLYNISPIQMARGGVCEAQVRYEESLLVDAVNIWLNEHELDDTSFFKEYDQVIIHKISLRELFKTYHEKVRALQADYTKKSAELVSEYGDLPKKIRAKIYQYDTNVRLEKHIEMKPFECSKDCLSEIKTYKANLIGADKYVALLDADIKSRKANLENQLVLFKQSQNHILFSEYKRMAEKVRGTDIDAQIFAINKQDTPKVMGEKIIAFNKAIKDAESDRYRDYMQGVAAKSFCKAKWTMNYWKTDYYGKVCQAIGHDKWISACLVAYGQVSSPSTKEITKVAEEKYSLK